MLWITFLKKVIAGLTVLFLLTSCNVDVAPVQSEDDCSSDATDAESVAIDSNIAQYTEDTSTIETANTPEELPNGLYYDVPNLPRIDDFSGTEYEEQSEHEEHKYCFLPVKSARIKHEGKITEISPDDPRLIRLLNFLAYGDDQGHTWIRQGLVEEEEISAYLSSDAKMLEVEFDYDPDSESTCFRTPKLVMSGDCYIIYLDTENGGYSYLDGVFAEQFWAYHELSRDYLPENIENPPVSLIEQWGNESYFWLDLIKYAGFDEEK